MKLTRAVVPFMLLVFSAEFAWAIPSPDIVINIFASLGQILGLLSVTFGGIAYSFGRRERGKGGGGSVWPFRVALGFLVLTGVCFALYYTYNLDLRNKRLSASLVRSSTEEGKKVGDASLRTLTLSEQVGHPRGIETGDLFRRIGAGQVLNLIDVREPEEAEAGMIAGAFHRRYPDLAQDRRGLTLPGKETVLICFSGNRSSELCERFAAEGIDCRFMVGGYEKWLAEGRPVGEGTVSLKELRKLPYFRGSDVLLDTPAVEKLVTAKNALFVDVRYPADFAAGHLPGAVNLPLRKMPSAAMWTSLRELPKSRPVIAACYDKRSCFYGLILGLRLDRLGYDFRGRYTVPHEFVSSARERGYVKEWRERQEGATFFSFIGKPIQWLLLSIQEKTGNFLFAILFTVFSLRVLLLPFSVKMEVDRIREQKRAPQVTKLKEKLKGEPRRLARALSSISKEDGITPLYNMAGSIIQMVLFIVLFSVVGTAAKKFGGDLFWMRPVAAPDPYRIMPVLVSAMMYLHLRLSAEGPGRAKKAIYLLSTLVILALTFNISGALNLYLSMSVGLLMLHGIAVRGIYHRRKADGKEKPAKPGCASTASGIVPFRHLTLACGGGNKALRLAEMLSAGFPVPDGFVISQPVLARGLSEGDRRRIAKLWRALSASKVAVRSSGLNEDSADMSYAGVFESILEVSWENLFEALKEVSASLVSERAAAYSGQEELGGVVVQKMVDAEYAGVMFTEHPGTSGSLMIEVVEGLGESLVSGQATPEPYQFGRYTGLPMFEGDPPVDLAPLIALGRKIERHFKVPQDIEWAYAKGEFYLLQTRDITSDSRRGAGEKGVFERERFRLLELLPERAANVAVLRQSELSELLPNPTRLSLSMMERLWEPGGTVDLACGRLGIPYHVEENSQPYVVTAFGSLYVNCEEEKKRTGKGPGAIATFRLSRAAEGIERSFREEFLPDYLVEIRLREAIELGRLPLSELVKLFHKWEREFVTEVYVQAEMINVAAEYYMQVAKQTLTKRGMNPAEYLGNLPATVVHSAMRLLPLIGSGKRELRDFLKLFGHRAPHDFEFSMPRYRENLEEVMRMVSRATAVSQETGPEKTDGKPPFGDRVLDLSVQRARNFQVMKEEAKHHSLLLFALLRELLLEMDRRLSLSGGIFRLEVEEVLRLSDQSFTGKAYGLIETRARDYAFGGGDPPPIDFSLAGLERFGLDLSLSAGGNAETQILRGLRISGSGEGVGRVRIMNSPEELDLFESGEILVTRFTDPTWTPIFPLAAGVVTEVGGWLSHAAIVAREMNLVGVVGVRDATRLLSTGDFVRLHEDGTVEIDRSVRREDVRYPSDRRITVIWDGGSQTVRLKDISRSGALIEGSSAAAQSLATTGGGTAVLVPEEAGVTFTVMRREEDILGVRFEKSLSEEKLEYLRQDQAELYDRQKNLLTKQRQLRKEQTRLLSVETGLHSELDLRELMKKIISATTELLSAERSTLFLHDGKNRELWSLVAEGTGEREIRFPDHLGIAGAVFTTAEAINIPDAYADSRFNPEVDRKTNYRTRSILCMPVERKGERTGVLQVLNKLSGPFDRTDEDRLKGFCGQVAAALQNAKMFDEAMRIRATSESIIEGIDDGVIILDGKRRVDRCNGALLRIFRADGDQLLGRSLAELFDVGAGTLHALMERFDRSGETAGERKEAVVAFGGRRISVLVKVVPMTDGSGDSQDTMLLVSEK